MAQGNRLVIPALPHFIAQSARAGQRSALRESADHRVFLHLLGESCARFKVDILAYSLLPRSYSLIVVPATAESLNTAIGSLDTEYAYYHNLRHMVREPVWNGPFQAVPMCWSHIYDAIAFVERESVRSERLTAAWAHPWSSAAPRLGRSSRPQWLNLDEWELHFDAPQWQKRLQAFEQESEFGAELGVALANGTALGELLAPSAPAVRKGPQRVEAIRIVERADAG